MAAWCGVSTYEHDCPAQGQSQPGGHHNSTRAGFVGILALFGEMEWSVVAYGCQKSYLSSETQDRGLEKSACLPDMVQIAVRKPIIVAHPIGHCVPF